MEKRKILLTLSYDGTDYYGWQRQANHEGVRTGEQALDEACTKLFQQPVRCIGASRTDRGVHALGQRATIEVESSIPIDKIPVALNTFLPDDMVAAHAVEVPESFHCRYQAKRKTYLYHIYQHNFRNPMLRNYAEFVRGPLDIGQMEAACPAFIGKHDFKAFCATGSSAKTTVRTIFDLHVSKDGKMVTISVTGDGFLYNMVRIIAGTLIYVGIGKLAAEDMESIIASCDRTRAGKTAGPQGLVLKEIVYDI